MASSGSDDGSGSKETSSEPSGKADVSPDELHRAEKRQQEPQHDDDDAAAVAAAAAPGGAGGNGGEAAGKRQRTKQTKQEAKRARGQACVQRTRGLLAKIHDAQAPAEERMAALIDFVRPTTGGGFEWDDAKVERCHPDDWPVDEPPMTRGVLELTCVILPGKQVAYFVHGCGWESDCCDDSDDFDADGRFIDSSRRQRQRVLPLQGVVPRDEEATPGSLGVAAAAAAAPPPPPARSSGNAAAARQRPRRETAEEKSRRRRAAMLEHGKVVAEALPAAGITIGEVFTRFNKGFWRGCPHHCFIEGLSPDEDDRDVWVARCGS